MTTLLVAHPDPVAVRRIAQALTDWGHQVVTTTESGAIPFLATRHTPDVVLMGHATPTETAAATSELLDWKRVPIVALSGAEGAPELLKGVGADWCIPPRCGRRVLKGAVKAALRIAFLRQTLPSFPVLALGRCLFCQVRQVVVTEEQTIPLTPIETVLLAAMAMQPGLMVPHHRLILAAWPGKALQIERRRMQMHIHRLRRKLAVGGPDAPRIELSVFLGYRIVLRENAEVLKLPYAA